MMRILFILLIILTLNNCKGQEKNKQTNETKKEKIMKTFDIETFNNNKKGDEYIFKLDENTTVKQQESNAGYFEFIKSDNNDFGVMNRYYNKNGKLMLTVEYFPNDFIVGIKKEYDEQGNLIKETDLDKPFTYTWEDIKKYLKQHKVEDLHKDIVGVQRFDNPNKTYWELEFQGEYKELKGQFLVELDGKTGEELLVKLFKGKDSEGEVGTIAVYDTIYKKNNK